MSEVSNEDDTMTRVMTRAKRKAKKLEYRKKQMLNS